MKTRRCKPENLKECASLLVEVYSQPEYNEDWTVQEAYSYLKRFYNIDPSMCYAAVANNIIIGAIFSYSYPWQSGVLVYIQELFVAPNKRKRGVAKALLSKLSKGKKTNIWLVAKEKTGAAVFYKKMGFKKSGPYKFHSGTIST